MSIYSNVFVQFQVQLSQEELQRIITEAKEELGCHNIITFSFIFLPHWCTNNHWCQYA